MRFGARLPLLLAIAGVASCAAPSEPQDTLATLSEVEAETDDVYLEDGFARTTVGST